MYRKLNKKIVNDRYPLLLIEDQLDRLKDDRGFSTIDQRNGFFQVGVEEQSRNDIFGQFSNDLLITYFEILLAKALYLIVPATKKKQNNNKSCRKAHDCIANFKRI